MPAMNNILSKWVPVAERSRSLALVYSGMYLGSVTGLAFSPFLIHQYGWPSVFYSFGSLGTVWFCIWLSKVRAHTLKLLPSHKCFLNEFFFFVFYKRFLYELGNICTCIFSNLMPIFCVVWTCRHIVRHLMILKCGQKKRS